MTNFQEKSKYRVLLIRPYYEVLRHELGSGFLPYEPLGLLCIQSALLARGHEVKLYDCLVENAEKTRYVKEKNTYRCGGEEKDILKKIKKFKPDIVCISGMFFAQKESFFRVAELVKQVSSDILVIGGGIFPSLDQEKILLENENFDIIVMGEGEETAAELLDNLDDPAKVKGVYFRNKNNKIIWTGLRDLKMELDELPFPHRDFSKQFNYSKYVGYSWSDTFNLRKFFKRFVYYHLIFLPVIREWAARYFNYKHRNLPKALFIPQAFVSTSRGCPNRCTFCSVHKFWKGVYRMRSAANVLKEIEQLVKHGVKEIALVDENFTISKERTIEICRGIIAGHYNIRLSTNSGFYAPSLDKEVLEYLYRAGLRMLHVSIENGDQTFLNNVIKKKLDLEQVKKVITQAKEIGLGTAGYFIFGYPEETKATMIKTLRYAFESGLDYPRFYILQPFPGTEVYEKALKMGAIKNGLNISRLRFTTDTPQVETDDFTKEDVQKIYDLAYDISKKRNYDEVKDKLENILGW